MSGIERWGGLSALGSVWARFLGRCPRLGWNGPLALRFSRRKSLSDPSARIKADAVASGFHFALKVNRYGETETGYLPHLKKTIYRHKAVALGYGLKLWPEDLATVKAKAPEAFNLEGL